MFDNKYFMLFVLVLHSMTLGSIFITWLTSTNLPVIIFPMAVMSILIVIISIIRLSKRIK